jgi:hypothetical protein
MIGDHLLILMIQHQDIPSRSKIETILKACNLQACPHLQLGNSRIAHSYNPRHCFSGERRTVGKIVKCRQTQCITFVAFNYPAKSSVDRPGELMLEINRYLGELKSPDDPIWLSQLIYPNHRLMTHHWSVGITKLKALQELECNKRMSKDTEYSSSFADENVYWGPQPPFSLVGPPVST